jgi:4-amino-4-deoxy-L-arabinose transferase-like glycosyltransferase
VGTDGAAPKRPEALALWGIVAVGALLRFGYVLLWRLNPLTWDAACYDEAARRLLTQGYLAYGCGDLGLHPNAFTTPGYTLFVAGTYAVFGDGRAGLLAVRLLQAGMSVGILLLVYLIARRVAGVRAGLLATALAAVYPPFVQANGDIMTEVLYTLLLTLGVWLALVCLESPRMWRFLLFGVVLGASALVRPAGILWALVPLAVLLVVKRAPVRDVARFGAVAALGIVLVLAPWWVRNYAVYNRFVPFNTSSANPLLVSTYWPAPPPPDTSVWPVAPSGDEFAMNTAWREQAIERLLSQMTSDPLRVLATRSSMVSLALIDPNRLMTLRWHQNPTPIERIWDAFARILHVFMLGLALVGAWAGRRSASALVVASVPAYLLAVTALTFALPRYLLPAMPVVCVLAPLGAVVIAEQWRQWVREPRVAVAPESAD